MSKKEKKKHPQNIIIVAVAVLGLALIIGNLGDDDTPDASVVSSTPVSSEQSQPEKSEQAEPEPEDQKEPENEEFYLSWDQPGQYGHAQLFNVGTLDEYGYIGFFIPAGDYEVTNWSTSSVQVSIHEDRIEPDANGFEYAGTPSDEKYRPIVLAAGDSGELSIAEGMYIKLSDGAENVGFRLK